MKKLLLSIFTVLSLTAGTAWADTFDDASAAYKRGDNTEAMKLYQLSAAQGDVRAQFSLGAMYDSGEGVTQDYAEALKWYQLAAAHGQANAQYNLGIMYNIGRVVAQDYAEAVKWYRLAAVQGHVSAQLNLGIMYHNGQGVAKDYVRAHMWLNLAATSGDADAVTHRDLIARKMTSQQIAQAQQMARDCQQKNFKGCD
jgi:TPR repeat protein